MQIHVVKKGDTVWSVARRYGVSPQRIIADNGLSGQPYLVVGQALIILIPETVHTVDRGSPWNPLPESTGCRCLLFSRKIRS